MKQSKLGNRFVVVCDCLPVCTDDSAAGNQTQDLARERLTSRLLGRDQMVHKTEGPEFDSRSWGR